MSSTLEVAENLLTQEPKEELNLNTAIKRVLKTASANRAVARGLREVCRTLSKDKAQLCILADDCDNDKYKKLIKAFCAFKKVDLLEVSSRKQLGEWVGLAKYDKQMRTRRVQKCAVAVVTDLSSFGEEQDEALNFVLKHLGKSD